MEGETVYTPDMVLGAGRKGLKVTYCTDTRPVEAIARHAAGSDLMICEGMYGEPGKEAKAREYKHMTFREAGKACQGGTAKGTVADAFQSVPGKTGGIYGPGAGDFPRNACAAKTENPWIWLLRRMNEYERLKKIFSYWL